MKDFISLFLTGMLIMYIVNWFVTFIESIVNKKFSKEYDIPIGLSKLERVKGRMHSIVYINDEESSKDIEYKDLDKVKRWLLPLFNDTDDLLKEKTWYRNGSRLIRR